MNAPQPHAHLKLKNLLLRCFAQRDRQDGTWFVICLELNLYARADSFEDAKKKLHGVIASYLRDALTTDVAYLDDLVPRRAPLRFWLKYAFAWCCVKVGEQAGNFRKFKEALPMVPALQ